jgi:hypothetical protein
MAKKRGLYDNIHAKRKRIAAGSGEKMRKVGAKGAPTAKNFKEAAKTAKMNYGGMVQTGTPDKDKIMGAGTMQQNPQQSLMEMNRNRVTGMKGGGKVPNKMKGFSKLPEKVQKKISPKLAKQYAHGGGVRKVRY